MIPDSLPPVLFAPPTSRLHQPHQGPHLFERRDHGVEVVAAYTPFCDEAATIEWTRH